MKPETRPAEESESGAMNCEEKKIIAQLDVTDMNDMNCSTVSHVPCPPDHDRCCSELVQYANRSNTRRRATVGHWTACYHEAHLREQPVQREECSAVSCDAYDILSPLRHRPLEGLAYMHNKPQ